MLLTAALLIVVVYGTAEQYDDVWQVDLVSLMPIITNSSILYKRSLS